MTDRPPIDFDIAETRTRVRNKSIVKARRALGIEEPREPEPQEATTPVVTTETRTETPPVSETPTTVAAAEVSAAATAQTERVEREAREVRAREIQERVDSARARYLTMQREKEKAQSLRGFFNGDRKRLGEIETQLASVEAEYKLAVAEYRGVKAEEAIFEGDRLAEDKAAMISGEKSQNKFMKWYQRLGETRGGKDITNQTGVKKFFNNRTLIGLGLAGVAIATGPVGWVGLGALGAKRIWSTIGAGVGVRELFLNRRRASLDSEVLPSMNLQDLNEWIGDARARAAIDGTVDVLRQKNNYKRALELRREKVRQELDRLNPEQRATLIEESIILKTEEIDGRIKNEKNWNRKAMVAGLAAGAFVGSGAMAELFKMTGRGVGGLFASPEQSSGATSIVLENKTTGIVGSSSDIRLKVGGRGIEGVLLDHLKTPQGAKMMEWLQVQDYNKGVTDKGALVHRFVSDYAKDHKFNIDGGGGKDLSKIFGAEVKVGSDGAIRIGEEKFMPAASTVAVVENHDTQTGPSEDLRQDNTASDIVRPPRAELSDTGEVSITEQLERAKQQVAEAMEMRRGISNTSPLFNYEGTTDVPDAGAEGDASDSDVTPEATTAKTLSPLEEARLDAALSQEKASYALQLMLNKDYSRFLQNVDLKGADLDKIRDMKYSEFLEQCNNSEKFQNKYSKLAELMKPEVKSQLESMDMKRLLIAIVRNKQEQGLV